MSTFIYKDYQLVLGKLCKFGVNESKHLLWKEGGVPCIDAGLWDKYKEKIKELYIRTNKGKSFRVSAATFELNKKELNLGFGRQYTLVKSLWDISVPSKQPEKQQTLPL